MRRHTTRKRRSIIRNFLFSKINKEFLIFLFFLCLSAVFWMALALNETYDKEIEVTVRISDVPSGVVITGDTETTVRVSIRDKGYFLMSYLYGKAIKPVDVDYATYIKSQDVVRITSAELQKMIYKQLYGSSKILSVKPDKCEFYYTKGDSKTVTVELNGKIQAAPGHYISRIYFTPETVSAYASESVIDSVTTALTEHISILNITDTVTQTVGLKSANGVKYLPAEVTITVCPDIMTEETIEVPVTAVNMPEGMTLRTFPAKVGVTFTVGASAFRNISADGFTVVADYNEIARDTSDKCKIYLRSYPKDVSSASLKTQQVDYIIESQ